MAHPDITDDIIVEKIKWYLKSIIAEYENIPEDTGDEHRSDIETGWKECAQNTLAMIKDFEDEL
tara:strand:- start:640 stop:831 length:192 start_codon:yes stop_codon:yes gene_type:complete